MKTSTRIGQPVNTALSTIITFSLCVPVLLGCMVRIIVL